MLSSSVGSDNLSSLQETGKVHGQGGIFNASGRNADESVVRAVKERWHLLYSTLWTKYVCIHFCLFIHVFTFLSISCPSKLSVHILLINILRSFWINSNPWTSAYFSSSWNQSFKWGSHLGALFSRQAFLPSSLHPSIPSSLSPFFISFPLSVFPPLARASSLSLPLALAASVSHPFLIAHLLHVLDPEDIWFQYWRLLSLSIAVSEKMSFSISISTTSV